MFLHVSRQIKMFLTRARSRIAASVSKRAQATQRVTQPPLDHSARSRRNWVWVWGYVGCEGLQERHRYSRTNFKLNRAAALAEWRQLLSA